VRKIHFFKAHSRLGIVNKPLHQDELNIGVEDAPSSILTEEFVSEFTDSRVSSFYFPLPEDLKEGSYFEVFSEKTEEFKEMIEEELEEDYVQVVIGGDHIVSLPSVLSVINRAGDSNEVGYIHFDSHGDINQFKESPSNNFHGMYLRPLFGDFDVVAIDQLVDEKMPSSNLLMIGNLVLDPGEKKFIERRKIRMISSKDIKSNTFVNFKKYINQFPFLHVSLDIDILDKSIAHATGIPAENGFTMEELIPFMKICSEHQNLSFDLSEYNPKKDTDGKTKMVCQEIIKIVLGGS
jgi:arginase